MEAVFDNSNTPDQASGIIRVCVLVGLRIRYRSFFQTLMKVWRDERLAGMYGGLSAHLCRVVPNTAIMFLVYENAVRILAADR